MIVVLLTSTAIANKAGAACQVGINGTCGDWLCSYHGVDCYCSACDADPQSASCCESDQQNCIVGKNQDGSDTTVVVSVCNDTGTDPARSGGGTGGTGGGGDTQTGGGGGPDDPDNQDPCSDWWYAWGC